MPLRGPAAALCLGGCTLLKSLGPKSSLLFDLEMLTQSLMPPRVYVRVCARVFKHCDATQ